MEEESLDSARNMSINHDQKHTMKLQLQRKDNWFFKTLKDQGLVFCNMNSSC